QDAGRARPEPSRAAGEDRGRVSAAHGLVLRALSAPWLSRCTGRLADLRMPGPLLRAGIRAYSRFYSVDWSEVAEPLEAFPTFNAFFTRRLRGGARPVAAG